MAAEIEVKPNGMATSLIETYGTNGQLNISGISSDELLFRGSEPDDPTRSFLQTFRSRLPDRVGVRISLQENGQPVLQITRGEGKRNLEYRLGKKMRPAISRLLVNLYAII
ncbi:hypothetical protein HYS94_01450 [Candidatus Daviesbacteria bacterium]|nr:hypothetical protein [Candidatus Daviesbacteria bacterium]